MMPSRWRCLLTSVIPGSSAPRGAYARIRPGTTPGRLGTRSRGPGTRMTTPAGPGAQARTLSTPITRAGEEGVLTRAGTPPNRLCGRTATLAGPSPRPRLGATPNRRRRMTVPAGAAAEVPRDKDRCPRHTAARTAGQPRARDRSCPRRRGRITLLEPASPPGPDRLLLQARLPGQPPPPPQATLRGRDPPTFRVQVRLLRPTSFPAMDRCFSKGRRGSWNGAGPRLTGFPGLTGSSPRRVRSGMPAQSSSLPGLSLRPTSKPVSAHRAARPGSARSAGITRPWPRCRPIDKTAGSRRTTPRFRGAMARRRLAVRRFAVYAIVASSQNAVPVPAP